ncbi:phytanoyl-CoA dioxygenase [Aspergillus campestris IBT 28561]|uniref:Phytanoyl-CoA dioxygenase n=1 Tax=Aspergillus campestris (strain IBT 28561) TaxID=1392248 RepID=A0A2I1D9U4_ASPC2|nr:phytanoyl-CoA dioxygenase [Aspergillus campestris IBT 28561]PKY06654.1 phytanoyl-CoA dioxygenase [Aspergillus campestris IBT 28561]
MSGLTPTQLATFHEKGYLVVEDYLTPEEVNSLLTETHHLLDTFDLDTHPLTQFTTGDDSSDAKPHVGDDYFLTSGDKLRFFFEPDAINPTGQPKLTRPKQQAVNKIGHSLHTLSPPFKAVSLNTRTAAIARSLRFQDPRLLQSMVICKQPRIGGAVPPHRDSEFLYTDPPSAVGFWFALQDAGPGNATLVMMPGTQGEGIQRRFVRGKEEEEVLNVKAGSLVLIHGNVLHKSDRNESERSRFAYTFHVIEGAEGWDYDERNWLQPSEGGFSRVYQ